MSVDENWINDPNTGVMPTCEGGCGQTLPPGKRAGCVYGHKGGCKPPRGPKQPVAEPVDPEIVDAAAESEACVLVTFTESQLDRIWRTLSPVAKALAILAGLNAPDPVPETNGEDSDTGAAVAE